MLFITMLYTCHVTEVVYYGGGGGGFHWPKTTSHKKEYHKVNKYLFEYLKKESFTHLQ